jgi:DNA-binding NarL/FixJ family response regulator
MHILIAENRKNVRSAIKLLLEQQPESYLVEEVGTIGDLLEYVANKCPDVIIIDWDLTESTPGMISALRDSFPHLILIVIDSDPLTKNQAFLAGSDYFVSKNDPPEQLMAAIRDAAEMIETKTVRED